MVSVVIMKNISIDQAVVDFYNVYKQDKRGGVALVKEYMKQYDITAIDLIITNQREIAKNLKTESHVFSPMKSAFYMLVLLGIGANILMMDNNIFIYCVLFVALWVPIWDSYGMAQKHTAHKQFADVVEAEIPFFREYSKEAKRLKIDAMLNQDQKEDRGKMFD